MTFLPIMERELRMATRARSTYVTRVAAGLTALCLIAWMVLTVGRMVPPEQLGANLFRTLTSLAFFCSLLPPGVLLTADCLSEEKRLGTIGLLFLTDLKGYDIIAGKLIATSLKAVYGLLAIFPALAIPFFLGGVTAGEFFRMTLVLVNTMFVSLAVGMAVSAVSRREHRATMITAGAMAALLSLGWMSPWRGFRLAFDAAYTANEPQFLASVISLHLLGWALLVLAGVMLERSWRDKPAEKKTGELSKLAARAGGFRPIVDPIRWLGRREERQGWVWLSLALPMVAALVSRLSNPFLVIIWMLFVHLILSFWMAWEAARRFNADRRTGALEMLLSTPLRDEEIVRGQFNSWRDHFALPLLVVLTVDVLFFFRALPGLRGDAHAALELLTIFASVMIVLGVNALAIGWAGLWLGLKLRRAAEATFVCLAQIVVVPMMLFVVATFFLVVLVPTRASGLLAALAVSWVVLGSAGSCICLEHARQKLRHGFRPTANQTNDPSTPSEEWVEPEMDEHFALLSPAKTLR